MGIRDKLSGFGFGLGLMYYFDPDLGNRRRALVRDQVVRAANSLSRNIDVMVRDTSHRIEGLFAETTAMFTSDHPSEPQLRERVRSTLGRHVSHPAAIDVSVAGDRVVLSGPILAHEVDQLLQAVHSVRGVDTVENRLEIHEEPGTVPGLQGSGRTPAERGMCMQETWSPAARLLGSSIGAGLMLRAVRSPGLLNLGLGALGLGLFTRAATNMETRRLVGKTERRGIDIQKTMNINAGIEHVYDLFAHPENFPRFMRNVREVEDIGGGRSRWTVAGPMGAPIRFEAVRTQEAPHDVLAWRSEPGSAVGHAGRIKFQRTPEGGTRVDIHMTYSPPAGAAGHVVASLFGADPKTEMDEDLLRMKTFLETGKEPHDAAASSHG